MALLQALKVIFLNKLKVFQYIKDENWIMKSTPGPVSSERRSPPMTSEAMLKVKHKLLRTLVPITVKYYIHVIWLPLKGFAEMEKYLSDKIMY
jgi:hypothetical protein